LAYQVNKVHVLASNGVSAALSELSPQWERAASSSANLTFDSAGSLKTRIDAGEDFDLAILTMPLIDDLVREGKISPETRTPLARVGVGIGIRRGSAKPNIATAAGLKSVLFKASSITYSQKGNIRPHIEGVFQRMGIDSEVKRKAIIEETSGRPEEDVAEGKAELVVALLSEILPVRGIELLGPFPEELQNYTAFAAGIRSGSRNFAGANSLLMFLTSPSARQVLKSKGLDPN